MIGIGTLFDRNRAWAAQREREQPGFFARLVQQQRPRFLWIGCSDSRVPANQITGLDPGEVFVHRNVGNVVPHADLNALSALQYAVDTLRVRHVIVVGHHGCGGVQAALLGARLGLADQWIRHIRDVRDRHAAVLERLPADARPKALVELNVLEQVRNVCTSTVLADAWARGQEITVHGWAYALQDGLLRDLGVSVRGAKTSPAAWHAAVDRVARRHARRSTTAPSAATTLECP